MLEKLLSSGKKLKVTIKDGNLGCSDVQDACEEEGSVVLYFKNGNYFIDRESDGENILCVDDIEYIKMIVDSIG